MLAVFDGSAGSADGGGDGFATQKGVSIVSIFRRQRVFSIATSSASSPVCRMRCRQSKDENRANRSASVEWQLCPSVHLFLCLCVCVFTLTTRKVKYKLAGGEESGERCPLRLHFDCHFTCQYHRHCRQQLMRMMRMMSRIRNVESDHFSSNRRPKQQQQQLICLSPLG